MIGQMAQPGLSMTETCPVLEGTINIGPQGGRHHHCCHSGGDRPHPRRDQTRHPVPASPRSVGCRELIRNHIQAARERDPRLQPWRAAFYAELGAALNAVICRISECSASVTSRSATRRWRTSAKRSTGHYTHAMSQRLYAIRRCYRRGRVSSLPVVIARTDSREAQYACYCRRE